MLMCSLRTFCSASAISRAAFSTPPDRHPRSRTSPILTILRQHLSKTQGAKCEVRQMAGRRGCRKRPRLRMCSLLQPVSAPPRSLALPGVMSPLIMPPRLLPSSDLASLPVEAQPQRGQEQFSRRRTGGGGGDSRSSPSSRLPLPSEPRPVPFCSRSAVAIKQPQCIHSPSRRHQQLPH